MPDQRSVMWLLSDHQSVNHARPAVCILDFVFWGTTYLGGGGKFDAFFICVFLGEFGIMGGRFNSSQTIARINTAWPEVSHVWPEISHVIYSPLCLLLMQLFMPLLAFNEHLTTKESVQTISHNTSRTASAASSASSTVSYPSSVEGIRKNRSSRSKSSTVRIAKSRSRSRTSLVVSLNTLSIVYYHNVLNDNFTRLVILYSSWTFSWTQNNRSSPRGPRVWEISFVCVMVTTSDFQSEHQGSSRDNYSMKVDRIHGTRFIRAFILPV